MSDAKKEFVSEFAQAFGMEPATLKAEPAKFARLLNEKPALRRLFRTAVKDAGVGQTGEDQAAAGLAGLFGGF